MEYKCHFKTDWRQYFSRSPYFVKHYNHTITFDSLIEWQIKYLNKMKKQYKHIPTGIIFTSNGASGYIPEGSNSAIPSWLIQGKDWQQVEQKEWEILSFINTKGNIFELRENNLYYFTGWNSKSGLGISLKSMLDGDITKIHSVKRLKDGIIFTIGDSVRFNTKTPIYNKSFIINNIFLRNDNVILLRSINNIVVEILDSVIKVEEVFTTKDGFKVFVGDSYYTIILHDLDSGILGPYIVKENAEYAYIRSSIIPQTLAFKSKEAAQEYIIENKPCLSLNEIKGKISNWNDEADLRKLVKSKL